MRSPAPWLAAWGPLPSSQPLPMSWGGLSLDMLEDAFGWTAEPAARLKAVAVALARTRTRSPSSRRSARGRTWLDGWSLPEHNVLRSDASATALAFIIET